MSPKFEGRIRLKNLALWALIVGVLLAFVQFGGVPNTSVSGASSADAPAAYAADCRCRGCGCKGGPGWRGPNGRCVSTRALARVCGTPPGSPCRYEGAPQVCASRW
jgi:hypothetical protein